MSPLVREGFWEVMHAASGYAARRLGFSLGTTVLVAVVWELLEPHIWPTIARYEPGEVFDESRANAVLDVGAAMAGYLIASQRENR